MDKQTYKVSRNEDGKIVIEDPAVLDLYELDGVEIDISGTPLLPGKRDECFGNGEHEGFACYPEHQADPEEALEDLLDIEAAERAMEEYRKNPKTYTFDEVLEELGITREELEAIDLFDEMGVPFAPDGSPLGIG